MYMNRINLQALSIVAGLALGPAIAADPPPDEAAEDAVAERVLGESRPLSTAPAFSTAARTMLSALAENEPEPRTPNDPARALQHLELAKRYFRDGLILEALSFAEGIPAGALPPERAQQQRTLIAQATVLDPRPGAAPQVPSAAFEAAAQREVFQALAQARAGQAGQAAATLSANVGDLTALPEPIQVRALPYLLLAAIDANDWQTSRALVEAFQGHPGLANSAAFSYLLGHTALQYGEKLRAFDHFAAASGSVDKWGHRARLQMVDLAVAHGGITADEQEHMLMRIYGAWRRGPEASGTLLRIEKVQLRAGDRLGALQTLSTLMMNHAGSPEAQGAQTRASAILADSYEALLRDGADLNSVIETHARIARDYRFFRGFDVLAERFGNYLLSVGITGLASQEFRLTGEYLAAAESLGLFKTPDERFDILRLKEAEALLAGGQLERAKALLVQPLRVDEPRSAARLASLRADYFGRTGEALQESADALEATPSGYIRELAEQYFAAEEWELARLEYLKLAGVLGDRLPTRDAVNLFLAAQRSGDTALSKVLGELLAQREDFDLGAFTEEVAIDAPIDPDIRSEALEALVERASQVLTDVDALVDAREQDQQE